MTSVSKPTPPPPPEPPPKPPKVASDSVQQRGTRQRMLESNKKGRRSTILTGSLGQASQTTRKTLLGE